MITEKKGEGITYKINSDLEKYKGKTLFPEKVALANKLLAKSKLPEALTKK
jgi:hypothetical protein